MIMRDERVMIARRPPDKRLGGLWEFPGGKVEQGESAEAALHRELHEELGCTVCITQTLAPFVHEYPWGSIELIPFLCELTTGSAAPHPHEHTALAWVERGQLSAYELAPADLPLITLI